MERDGSFHIAHLGKPTGRWFDPWTALLTVARFLTVDTSGSIVDASLLRNFNDRSGLVWDHTCEASNLEVRKSEPGWAL